jgi:HK97 family phage portal protein
MESVMKIFGFDIHRSREVKESRTWPSILALVTGQSHVWPKTNYESLARAGYQNAVDVWACIDLVSKAIASIPWVLYKQGTDKEEIENHPLLDLWSRPNPAEGGARFRESVVKYLLIAGNAYIEANGPKRGAPRELYCLRPDRVTVVPGTSIQLVGGFKYKAAVREANFTPDEVLQIKEFHPTDDWYGLSRLEVAAHIIDISNLGNEWNANLLKNDARPSGILRVTGNLTQDQRDALRNSLTDKYSGAANAGKTLILEGVEDWKGAGLSPVDMDWLEADKNVTRKICRVFGVAPELIGDSANKTYSNYKEARLAFYMETVLPLARMIRDELNNWLVPKFGEGIELDIDIDQIEAMQEKREEAYQRIQSAYWLTLNEKRDAVGYDAVEGVLGDTFHIPMGLTTMTAEEANAPEPEPEPVPEALAPFVKPAEDEPVPPVKPGAKMMTKGFWSLSERRELLWKSYVTRIGAKSKSFDADMEAFLKKQATLVVDKIQGLSGIREARAKQLLDKKHFIPAYIKQFKGRYFTLYRTAKEAGISATQGKLYDLSEAMKADADLTALDGPTRTRLESLIKQSAEFIHETSIQEIQDLLSDAIDADWTLQELAQQVKDYLYDASPARAKRIAITESAMLENCGTLDGYKSQEFVNKKGWMCSFVKDSRDAHIEADGQEVGIDDPFTVGGEQFDYPGDRSHGPDPGNSINCLCYMVPIVE